MLTDRQKLTILHLEEHHEITDPKGIIKFCNEKLAKRRKSKWARSRGYNCSKTRKHSRKHYGGIIDFLTKPTK